MSQILKKVSIITGHYGVGKTNIAINMALKIRAEIPSSNVSIVDLDTVNPYFRTADFKDLFAERNIELIVSKFANGNLDIPALNFGLSKILTQNNDDYFILDVGGDDAGATALGRYSDILLSLSEEKLDVFYVVNMYRFLTQTVDEATAFLSEIESSSGVKITKIINNSNLGKETTSETIEKSRAFIQSISEKTNKPIFDFPSNFSVFTKEFY